MWTKEFAVWCGAALIAMQVNAETIDPRLAKVDVCGGYEIVHVNGINTSFEGAQSNVAALVLRYGNAHAGHLLRYGLAYNRTNWIIADLQQSYAQLIADYPGVRFRDWLRAVINGIWPNSVPASATADFAGRVGNLLGLNRPNPYADPDLARMLNEIAGFHRPNARLALVAHSQGTIYANFLHDRMTDAMPAPLKIPVGELGIVDVAAVVETIRGAGGQYVTSQIDLVVNFVRLAAVKTLPRNTFLGPSGADWLGHNFINIYLAQANSRNAIVEKMETVLSSLTSSAAPLRGLRLRAEYWNCSGTSYYPYPAPWRCPFPTGSSIFEPPAFTQPVVRYGMAGTATEFVRYGSESELADLAQAHATGCVNLLIADYQRVQLTGDRSYHVIPGCGPGYPWQTPYGRGDDAWEIYSGDLTEFRMSGDTSTYPYTSIPYVTTVNADLYPACRRALVATH